MLIFGALSVIIAFLAIRLRPDFNQGKSQTPIKARIAFKIKESKRDFQKGEKTTVREKIKVV